MTAELIHDGAWLDAQRFPPLTALELLTERRCHPACLLAMEDGGACHCACHGDYHGVLADAVIPESSRRAEPWFVACDRAGFSASDLRAIPTVESTRAENRVRRLAEQHGYGARYVRRLSRTRWGVTVDLITAGGYQKDIEAQWSPDAVAIVNRLSRALLMARRCEMAFLAPSVYMSAHPFSDLTEARLVAALVAECWEGKLAGTSRAVAVLEGRGVDA